MDITLIRTAQADISEGRSNTSAVIAVLTGCADVIEATAHKAARHGGSLGYADMVDEYSQIARIELWNGLPRFAGDNMKSFYAWAHTTAMGACQDAAYVDTGAQGGGVSGHSVKDFGKWVAACEGDAFAAEQACQTAREGFGRFSAERAHATRLAWQGCLALDAPFSWVAGSTSASSVEGGDDFQTMTLLDRIALRTEVNAELLEPGDLANYQREQTTARVRLTLDEMGPQQAEILRYTYGIAGRPLCEKDSEAVSVAVSAAVGPITPARVPVVRFKASETFAKRYASRVAGTVEERDEWLAAAAGVKAARK